LLDFDFYDFIDEQYTIMKAKGANLTEVQCLVDELLLAEVASYNFAAQWHPIVQ
jgi:hypothetical protein